MAIDCFQRRLNPWICVHGFASKLSRIVRPVQNRLPLTPSALHIATFAILLHLSNVTLNRFPAFNLPLVIFAAATHVIAAVPLKPAARIVLVDPSFFFPDR